MFHVLWSGQENDKAYALIRRGWFWRNVQLSRPSKSEKNVAATTTSQESRNNINAAPHSRPDPLKV